ncbi:unnamed protein product [Merluccius merluccius]
MTSRESCGLQLQQAGEADEGPEADQTRDQGPRSRGRAALPMAPAWEGGGGGCTHVGRGSGPSRASSL